MGCHEVTEVGLWGMLVSLRCMMFVTLVAMPCALSLLLNVSPWHRSTVFVSMVVS